MPQSVRVTILLLQSDVFSIVIRPSDKNRHVCRPFNVPVSWLDVLESIPVMQGVVLPLQAGLRRDRGVWGAQQSTRTDGIDGIDVWG